MTPAPAVAGISGGGSPWSPFQVGKTAFALEIAEDIESIYLDRSDPSQQRTPNGASRWGRVLKIESPVDDQGPKPMAFPDQAPFLLGDR